MFYRYWIVCMKTIRLDLEYDGTPFAGWQRQPHKPTIQGWLEDILGQVHSSKITVYGSSRTDSGVHAMGQVAHFYTEKNYPCDEWRRLLNDSLPPEIRVIRSQKVPDTFHAQKQVISKIYDFRILNGRTASALDRRVYFFPRPIDWGRVERALPYFVGEHDFKSFQGSGSDVLTTTRKIFNFTLHEEGKNTYRLRVEGSGFLKQMVRNMVGTLIEIGEFKREPESIHEILLARDRRRAGKTVPASGLFLMEVKYAT